MAERGTSTTFRMEDGRRRSTAAVADDVDASAAGNELDEALRAQIGAVDGTAEDEPVRSAKSGDVGSEETKAAADDEEAAMPPEVVRQLREAGVAAGQRDLCYRTFLRLERGRGHMTPQDVFTGLQLLGQCPQSPEQVSKLLGQHGLVSERLLLKDFAEFCARVCRSRDEVRSELEASFRVLDPDGSGFLDPEELRRALFGVHGEDDNGGGVEDFEELARLADTRGDGRIDCAEFCRLVTMGVDEMRQTSAASRVTA